MPPCGDDANYSSREGAHAFRSSPAAAQVLHLTRLFSFRNTARILVKIKDKLGGRLADGGGGRKKLTAADTAS